MHRFNDCDTDTMDIMDINAPLQDWEISRLSERISPDEFGRFALGDLGITKVRVFEYYNTEHVCCQV